MQGEREYRESAAEPLKGSQRLRAGALSLVHKGQPPLSEVNRSIRGKMK